MDPAAVAAERARKQAQDQKMAQVLVPLFAVGMAIGVAKMSYDWWAFTRRRKPPHDPDRPWDV